MKSAPIFPRNFVVDQWSQIDRMPRQMAAIEGLAAAVAHQLALAFRRSHTFDYAKIDCTQGQGATDDQHQIRVYVAQVMLTYLPKAKLWFVVGHSFLS